MSERGYRNAKGHERNRRAQKDRSFSAQAPGQRRRSSDPARLTAYQALRAVNGEDAYGNLVLPQLVRKNRLDKRDAAFATELAYGAMRRQGTWDAVLEHCVDRPLKELDPQVLDALRLGVHQLLAMRVPDHAALDATVGLVRGEIGQGPAGLVNAVLRKVARQSTEEWLDQLESEQSDDLRKLGVRYSHPAWEVRALRRALRMSGRSPEEIEELLEANNAPPRVHLVALPDLGSLDAALDEGATPGTLVADSAESAGGDVHRIPGTRDGTVRVQDAGSQLVARVLAEVPVEDDHGKWADFCAVPEARHPCWRLWPISSTPGCTPTKSAITALTLSNKLLLQFRSVPGPCAWATVATSPGRCPAASTACSWTCRARDWARCGVVRKRGGAVPPRTLPSSDRCSASS